MSTNFIEGSKSSMSVGEVKFRFVEDSLIKYSEHLQIFTDGSKLQSGLVGAAMYIPYIRFKENWKLDSGHSVLVAELFAIYRSLLWIANDCVGRSYVVFKDSLSALMVLLNTTWKSHIRVTTLILELFDNLYAKKKDIYLQWIPSHRGIDGNEVVDVLAKEACATGHAVHLDYEFEEHLRLLGDHVKQYRSGEWERHKGENLFITQIIYHFKNYEWISLGDRKSDVLLARFRNGCVGLQKYLYTIKRADSYLCVACGRRPETIQHFIFECPSNNAARKKLVDDLLDLNIRPNLINMSLLFTGGPFTNVKRLKIMKTFLKFVAETGRENL